MSQTKQASRSIATNWVALVIGVVVSFFLSPFVVNKLGSVYFGIWAVTMQFTGYLYLLDFGVRESVVRYTSKYCARKQSHQLNQVLTSAMAIYLPVTALCVLLGVVCAWLLPVVFDLEPQHVEVARWTVVFVGLTIAQTFVFNVFTGILQGLNRFDIMNWIGIGTTLLRTLIVVILLQQGYGLIALAATQFAVSVLGGTISAFAARSLLRQAEMDMRPVALTRRRLRALANKIFGYGFWVLVNNIAQKINFTSDAIIVGLFQPIRFVTYYAIAGSLIEYLRALINSTAQVFNPLSSRLLALRQSEAIGPLLISGAKLTVLVTLPIALTYAILGEQFIGLWMGKEFMGPAGQVLLVLGLTQIISAPHYVISSVLYGMSQHRSIALLRVGEAVANLVLSIVLVRKLGLVGVALGTAISHGIMVVLLLPGIVCRRVKLSIGRYFLGVYRGPLLAAIPFVAGAVLARNYLPAANLPVFFVHIAVLSAVYMVSVYAVALDASERSFVRSHLVKLKLRTAS